MGERETIDRRMRIHEVCKITPSFSSDSDSKTRTAFTISLTYFDTYWFYFPPVEILFFYELSCDADSFNSVILPNLKHSLSLTLSHYLPLAGHLMWPLDAAKPAVYYFPDADDGVSFIVAESSVDFNLISLAVDFHPLVPQLSISDDKAELIAIQITLFPNQGFSIGISVHHSFVDGKSFMLFVKSWAYLCKQHLDQFQAPCLLLPEHLTPCFDRTLIKDPNGIDMVYVKHLMMDFIGSHSRSLKVMPVPEVGSNLIRKTFKLKREDINKLRDKVLSVILDKGMEQSERLHLSTFVLTCAHVFVCLVKTKSKGEDADTNVLFCLTADCRSRLDPPIPLNYFGNCVTTEPVAAKASDFIDEKGVAFVAEKLSDEIRGLKKEAIEGSEGRIVKEIELMKEISGEGHSMITVAGTNHIDFYNSDFGWGKPKKVEVVSIDTTGAISLMESRDGNGVEVGVVLNKQEMEVFASLFFNGLNDEHKL